VVSGERSVVEQSRSCCENQRIGGDSCRSLASLGAALQIIGICFAHFHCLILKDDNCPEILIHS